MQDQDMPSPGRVLDDAQQCVMCVLLAPVGSGICSLGELALAVGDPTTAELAVAGLHADGLVHSLDGFVFATRVAARSRELDLLGALPHP
jgi:hypothetical protein